MKANPKRAQDGHSHQDSVPIGWHFVATGTAVVTAPHDFLNTPQEKRMDNQPAVQHAVLTAKRIIESESRHNFDVYAVDDSEHIPRMARIADAACEVLAQLGVSPDECSRARSDLIDHARRLYVTEWMRAEPDEDPLPAEEQEQAVRSFGRYLRAR